jgi:serine/threonine-protein kinase
VRSQPERLENARPELPPALARIVHKMLAKDPAERFQGPRELLRELRELVKEGDEFQWPADLDEFDTVEMASLATRGEATQRLQTLMSVESRSSKKYQWIGYIAAPILAALLLGGGVSWALREPYLLNVPSSKVPQIPKFETAQLQFEYAARMDPRIESWKAVIDNFKNDQRYTPQAKRELAKSYLQSDSKAYRAQAMRLFTELADQSSDIEKENRAFGVAGQSIVYSLENKPEESAQKLAEFFKIAGNWDSGQASRFIGPDMAQTLGHVVQRNRKAIGDAKANELENWLQQHFADEAE